ncbi:S-adenosyl-L-methionine-dependent methyltransferase [Aspergillus japonicus CBS 114.51]|uniref:S-adenosyl-L-methionine-dependent methyltransferase n=1 Tax=Aspergillus japonicus CBS 114.51 TaxID=1448312 RepID=A0A8T8XAT8_ASPJA|nr:S-adenosyl-L-methionine-dependent methyltransferase [Aspergillus japonicus CBS 114.51]RAH85191.1 S-adenosyl-L-methionine-dependent methyltransferase [Aspergillus japonicus CBS 114.51]
MSSLPALARTLEAKIEALVQELAKVNLDRYTFEDEDAPLELPLSSAQGYHAKAEVIEAAEKILRLARGPLGHLQTYATTGLEVGTIQTLIKLKIPSMIPLGTSKSCRELASEANVSVQLLSRMIALASTCGFLAVGANGEVRHNSMSSIFVRDQQAAGGASWTLEIYSRVAPNMYESLQLNTKGDDPAACAVGLAYRDVEDNGRLKTLWDVHAQSPTLDRQFHELMAASCASPMESVDHVVNGFDWKCINSLVDVGGSIGHTCFALTARYPHLQCTVQDLATAISEASPTANVRFMAHDFFEPQTVTADAYLYRFILHDWSDEDCKRILSAAVAGLPRESRLIIMDMVLPAKGTRPWLMDKYIRTLDIAMYALLAGKERSLEEFRSLVAAVAPELQFESCHCPVGSALSILVWRN